jgi:hypothetical protein
MYASGTYSYFEVEMLNHNDDELKKDPAVQKLWDEAGNVGKPWTAVKEELTNKIATLEKDISDLKNEVSDLKALLKEKSII